MREQIREAAQQVVNTDRTLNTRPDMHAARNARTHSNI
jgi:hypothetical protein